MKKKKSGAAVPILLTVAAIAIVAALGYWYVSATQNTEADMFKQGTAAAWAKLYSEILDTDFENQYPESPEAVIDFYNDTFYMLYSNALADKDAVWYVMMRQREVLGEDILDTDPDTQYANLIESLSVLEEMGGVCLSVERKGTVYDQEEPTMCKVQTVIYYNSAFGTLYRNYYLQQGEDGRWRVYTWEAADENFNPV